MLRVYKNSIHYHRPLANISNHLYLRTFLVELIGIAIHSHNPAEILKHIDEGHLIFNMHPYRSIKLDMLLILSRNSQIRDYMMVHFVVIIWKSFNYLAGRPVAPLLTWFNFNPSMDKESHAMLSVGWNLLSVPKPKPKTFWHLTRPLCMMPLSGGAFQKRVRALKPTSLNFQCCIKINVWVRYFVWNFKGYLWNSTQNILPIHEKCGFYSQMKI